MAPPKYNGVFPRTWSWNSKSTAYFRPSYHGCISGRFKFVLINVPSDVGSSKISPLNNFLLYFWPRILESFFTHEPDKHNPIHWIPKSRHCYLTWSDLSFLWAWGNLDRWIHLQMEVVQNCTFRSSEVWLGNWQKLINGYFKVDLLCNLWDYFRRSV